MKQSTWLSVFGGRADGAANANQLIITLNGIVQAPGEAFTVQGSNIVFADPPQPPANVQ